MTGIPILPPSASSVSTEVDLLYFFLTGVTAFFVVLVGALVVYFTVRYRRRDPRRRRRRHSRLAGPRTDLDDHPAGAVDGHVRLGRVAVLPVGEAAAGRDGAVRRREAVDVEGAASRGRPRDQRAARARRSRRAHHARVRGRHPRLRHPGVPREDGRGAGQADDALVQGDRPGHVPHLLRPILRHATFADDRRGDGDGAAGVPGLALRRPRRRRRRTWPRTASSCSGTSPARRATLPTERAAARRSWALRAAR